MPIFISYSSADRKFVDHLATQLVIHKVSVWLDKWEIHVGDSLITKIQEGITGASALVVVLSKHAAKSEWCRKELNSALMRELDEKRVVVLPLLLEDCEIPLFLREKRYADFRTDYDQGLRSIIEAVARVTNEWRTRITEPGWHTDSAVDWGMHGSDHIIRLTMVEQAIDQPYCVLGISDIIASGPTADWFQGNITAGTEDEARARVIYALAEAIRDDENFDVLLEDQHQVVRHTSFALDGHTFIVNSSVRWLGLDTGRNVLFRMGGQIDGLAEAVREKRRTAPTDAKRPAREPDANRPDSKLAKQLSNKAGPLSAETASRPAPKRATNNSKKRK